jgi:hypothetical protein
VVTERNAHSWPEVYFREQGWIAFEPTAAYETLTRPDDPIGPAIPDQAIQPPPERSWDVVLREWWRRVRPASRQEIAVVTGASAAVVALVLLFAALVARAVRAYRRHRLSPVQGIALCYAEMVDRGARLGADRRPQDTPAEYARLLAAALRSRVARWPWTDQDLMPRQEEVAHDTTRLSQIYQRASYYPQSVTDQERATVDRLWRDLERQLRRLGYTSLDKSEK